MRKTQGKSYRWAHPLEWLDEKIDHAPTAELVSIAKQLAAHLDGDHIQDLFQDEMNADGYFKARGDRS